MFAHLFLNYDIKHLAEKPKPKWLGRTSIPPKVVVEVRRRKLEP